MIRVGATLSLVTLLAACGGSEPAGGYGPFDPPPPAPLRPVQIVPPTVAEEAPGAVPIAGPFARATPEAVGIPRSVLAEQPDPNAALARDVTATLRATAPAAQPAQIATATPAPVPAPADGAAAPAGPGDAVAAGPTSPDGDMGIDPNDQSINLALSSQAVQERQRAVAQARREAAAAQRIEIAPQPVPEQNIDANVVRFARETTNPVGTKVYNRPRLRDRFQSRSVCRRFSSDDEAQRQFLANGGPENDRYNLDPDGDGFACQFDPEKYRKLKF